MLTRHMSHSMITDSFTKMPKSIPQVVSRPRFRMSSQSKSPQNCGQVQSHNSVALEFSVRHFYCGANTAKDFRLRLIYAFDDVGATLLRPKCISYTFVTL